MQIEVDVVAGREPGEGREEPRRHRIGVHGERDADPPALRDLVDPHAEERVVLEQSYLAGQADDGLPRLGQLRGLRTHDQDPTELLLQRLQALTHRRRRDLQSPGSGVERALVDDRGERGGEFGSILT